MLTGAQGRLATVIVLQKKKNVNRMSGSRNYDTPIILLKVPLVNKKKRCHWIQILALRRISMGVHDLVSIKGVFG